MAIQATLCACILIGLNRERSGVGVGWGALPRAGGGAITTPATIFEFMGRC